MTTAVWVAMLSPAITVVAVIVSIVFGVKNSRAAKRSAIAAESSANEAQRANARAERAEQRAVARNDVQLRTYRTTDDELVVRNDGLDTSLSTTVSLTIWGEPVQHLDVGDLAPGQTARLMSIAAQLDRDEAELAEWDEFEAVVTYTERFSWRSEGGAPHVSEEAIQHASRD